MSTPQPAQALRHEDRAHRPLHDAAMGGLSLASGGFVSTPERFLATAARLGPRAAHYTRTDAGWQATSWTDFAAEVKQAARALVALGVRSGDAVAILGFNRAEWSVIAFAAMMIDAVPAGIYWTSSGDDIEYILNHSQAPVLVCENAERFEKVASRSDRLPHLRRVVMMRGAPATQAVQLGWTDFLQEGQAATWDEVEQRLRGIRPEHTGSLIYTSGTTGPSKAVVLSHANLAWASASLVTQFGANDQDRMLSYLPFAHVAEQVGCIHNHATAGVTIYYARSMEELGEHLKEVRPTVFFGVPRVWEKMHAAIEAKLAAATGPKAHIARWALRVGRRWHEADLAGRRPGALLDLQKRIASRLIYRKVQEALGFGEARLLISGAAPIAPENLAFFTGLDLVVRELYGQSEVSGPSTLSIPGQTRLGSVGKILPGMEVRIAEDGEIHVRGPNIFQGYAGREAETAEVFDGDWLLTGDLGRLDEDGFLYITGRKKDLIITSGGKNVSPGNLEADLMTIPLVEHAVACGDGRHYLVALLTLKPDALAAFATEHGLPADDVAALAGHPKLQAALQAGVDEVNTHHARVSHIRKFAVIPRSLTIEAGELTPTLKVKRKVVLERERALVESMYAESR
ncbi:MAG: long-chain fatty acid--CoA ligase [Aquabacterium sp.]|jgi:long-chain acyl-CoA synthetase|nr:MAG: long-chain fatty acid--CoA ligase [Aquabacterium sp.]